MLKRIVAHGDAQSLYRLENRDTTHHAPAAAPPKQGLNYLAGEKIELTFAAGELEVANVTGLQRGLYLDPTPPTDPPGEPHLRRRVQADTESSPPDAAPAPAPETPRP